MTQHNTTPEGFRTAAYLATRQRIDAARSRTGKTSKKVICNPPNVQCGGRCIPPNWDCRLKGQGTDPQLRAVKTDPLGGLANIQRGIGRVGKGVARGNISEVEGGKRAIIRGVVKAVPGDIQRKKELTKQLEDRTRAIGIGMAVLAVGLGAHSLLMKKNTFGYRDGVGANINDAVRLGLNKVLDATPLIGADRAQRRARVAAGIEAQLQRQQNPLTAQLTNQLAKTRPSSTDEDSSSRLVSNLRAVDTDTKYTGASSTFGEWDKAHQKAFWSTTKLVNKEERSIFARPATDEFLARQFKLQGDDTLTSQSIKGAITRQLTTDKAELIQLAQQQGFRVTNVAGGGRVINPDDRLRFIQGMVRTTLPKGAANDRVRSALTEHLQDTLNLSPKYRADKLYNTTLEGFDTFYREKASVIESATVEPTLSAAMRRTGSADTLADARVARAAFVSGKSVAGRAHAELLLRQHYAQRVTKTPRGLYRVTDRLATAAASEIEGRTVGPTEAFRVLEREGISGAVPVPRSPASRTQASVSRGTQAQITDIARSLRESAQRRGETMSLEASYRAARTEIARRQRGDARTDAAGKPCGASHIPKAHECRKSAGGAAQPSPTESDKRSARTNAAIAATAAGAALTVGGLLAYKQRQELVPSLSQKAIRGLSAAQVKEGLDKLPEKFRDPARQLVGDAKLAAAHMALRAQGSQIRAVDVKHNFSTWVTPNGTHLSVGSIGDSLLTFGSERKGNVSKFPQYGLGFTIDSKYDAAGGVPSSQAKQLIRTTKAMYQSQMEMLPENAVLFAVPHKDDGKGAKRKSIYEGMGFQAIPGLKTDRLWALKNQGKFTKIPEEQMGYMADLIRGDRADAAGNH